MITKPAGVNHRKCGRNSELMSNIISASINQNGYGSYGMLIGESIVLMY